MSYLSNKLSSNILSINSSSNNDLATDFITDNIKEYAVPEGVTTIRDGAFYRMKNLEKLTISDSVTSIGNDAISFCTGLKEIIFSDKQNLITLGDLCFNNVKLLDILNIPEGVINIGNQCFSQSAIRKVIFPSTVLNIKGYLFYQCTNLKQLVTKSKALLNRISFYNFPNTVEQIVLACEPPTSILADLFSPSAATLTDIYVKWSEGEVPNAPWGATNAIIHYDSEVTDL